MPFDLLYRDDDCAALYKPAGLLMHRSRLDAGARRFVLQEARNQLGTHVFPVHRLDKPTAGVLLLALHADAARTLGAAFRERRVVKTYLAVVRGWPDAAGVIDVPLARPEDAGGDGTLQEAVTAYRRLATAEKPLALSRYPTSRYALVEARPETGRYHQIRRHLNHLAHPIIGDNKHGDYRHNRYFTERFGRRLLLVATALTFPRPATGRPVTVEARPDDGFRAVTSWLGWTLPGGGGADGV